MWRDLGKFPKQVAGVLIVYRHLRLLLEGLKIISVHRDRPARAFPDDTQTVRILRTSDDRTLFFGVSRMARATKLTEMDAVALGKLSHLFVQFGAARTHVCITPSAYEQDDLR